MKFEMIPNDIINLAIKGLVTHYFYTEQDVPYKQINVYVNV